MDKSKIYLDLSKCTEEKQKHIISLLPEPRNWKVYAMFDNKVFLNYNVDEWIVGSKFYIADKQELTYPEFIKLFENDSLSLQTKLEMFYDFLYERGVAKQLGVGIDTIVKHFIDEKLLSND